MRVGSAIKSPAGEWCAGQNCGIRDAQLWLGLRQLDFGAYSSNPWQPRRVALKDPDVEN